MNLKYGDPIWYIAEDLYYPYVAQSFITMIDKNYVPGKVYIKGEDIIGDNRSLWGKFRILNEDCWVIESEAYEAEAKAHERIGEEKKALFLNKASYSRLRARDLRKIGK